MRQVSIIGATGYTGAELLRILLAHPSVRVAHVTSESSPGRPIASIHADLAGRTGLVTERCDPAKVAADSELVFLCLPHAHSARMGQSFLNKKVKVIDLSADFRLRSKAEYKRWYGQAHPCPRLLRAAVYGLPEVYRERIAQADLVANPGCYATASILSALPLARSGWIRGKSIIVDAKSGVSGAGKKLDARYLFCEDNENFLAYGVARHRHAPEIEQELGLGVTFVPHLLPVNRGILAAVYADLKKKISSKRLWELYADFYADEAFVVVLPEGDFPELKSVQRSNFCHIGVRVDERAGRAIVIGAIDNLGKGASSQAVQNMNLMFGFDETLGLP